MSLSLLTHPPLYQPFEVKILRIFRTLRVFGELRLMLDCVLGSLLNVMWCLILLIFVMYIFALLVQQTLVGFLQEEATKISLEENELLYQYFGSVGTTLVTLFQSITSGVDWKDPYDVLRISGDVLPAAFIFYVAFVFISVWNIVPWIEKRFKRDVLHIAFWGGALLPDLFRCPWWIDLKWLKQQLVIFLRLRLWRFPAF